MRRIMPPGIHALEVWDLPVGGQPLQALRHAPTFGIALAQMITALRETPPLRLAGPTRALAYAIGHVHLLGGGATPALVATLAAVGIAATAGEEPLFAAARAGLRRHGGETGRCVDVGQTAIKIAEGVRTRRIERDAARAPFRDGLSLDERPAARGSTIDFLAGALRGADGPVVLALPCELDEAGVASGCSYPWRSPDPDLLCELAFAAALDPERLLFLNDAELAALAAEDDALVPRHRTCLVLTLGFGVGAALLEPRA